MGDDFATISHCVCRRCYLAGGRPPPVGLALRCPRCALSFCPAAADHRRQCLLDRRAEEERREQERDGIVRSENGD